MKRIILEKILVYILGFTFLFTISSNHGERSLKAENEFLSKTEATMKLYNYTKTECDYCLVYDLEYTQGDNKVSYYYDSNIDEVKITDIYAKINLKFNDNLDNTYKFLSELYEDDISTYSDKIQNMINEFINTGKEQIFQDLNKDRQLTLRISKTDSLDKDYQLHYSIDNLER